MAIIAQYDVVLVNLDPNIGSEMKKTRPCVVISPNEMNKHINTIIIAPLTISSKSYPTRIKITHNEKKGTIALDQIRAIDRQRIIKIFNRLSDQEIKSLKSVLKEMLIN